MPINIRNNARSTTAKIKTRRDGRRHTWIYTAFYDLPKFKVQNVFHFLPNPCAGMHIVFEIDGSMIEQ